jgi:hypothetical protein
LHCLTFSGSLCLDYLGMGEPLCLLRLCFGDTLPLPYIGCGKSLSLQGLGTASRLGLKLELFSLGKRAYTVTLGICRPLYSSLELSGPAVNLFRLNLDLLLFLHNLYLHFFSLDCLVGLVLLQVIGEI